MPIINTIGNSSGRAYGFTRGGGGKILISSTPGPAATITTYSGYIVFKFTASATLNVGAGAPGTADVFAIGGGNNGNGGSPGPGGAGGAGGAGGRYFSSPAVTITAGSPIPITVGAGGNNASLFSSTSTAPQPTSGPAGGVPGGAGGTGVSTSFETGSPTTYGGGGGGGGSYTPLPPNVFNPGGAGGSVGGGAGGRSGYFKPLPPPLVFPGAPGDSGTGNTGGAGGGGGGGYSAPTPGGAGGTGGSGVVIVRFPDSQFTTT